jgi:hypothetical protein
VSEKGGCERGVKVRVKKKKCVSGRKKKEKKGRKRKVGERVSEKKGKSECKRKK